MAAFTKIEWTDATWNPITGCRVLSPGCKHCYAMKLAGGRMRNHPSREGLTVDTDAGPVWNGEIRFNEEWLADPIRWTKPKQVFVCAHSDLFYDQISFGQVMRIWNVMGAAPHHIYQILTKRPDRMAKFLAQWADLAGEPDEPILARGPAAERAAHPSGRGQLFADMLEAMGDPPAGAAYPTFDWMGGMRWWDDVSANAWLGFSAEDQQRFNERAGPMREIAARGWMTWCSAEPLLGPIDIANHPYVGAFLHWMVVGGESGPGARPMHPAWVRAIRDACALAGIPFFFKQWGEWLPVDAIGWTPPSLPPKARTYMAADGLRDDALREREERLGEIDPTGQWFVRVGKKAAGRMLDGRTHDDMPARPIARAA